jgi:hypothetical protein
MLPATLTFPLSAALTGIVIGRTLRFKWLTVAAFVAVASCLGGVATLNTTSPLQLQVVLLIVLGLAMGVPFISKTFMVQSAVVEEDVFMATALVSTATSIGESFGVAVASAAFQGRWDVLLSLQSAETHLNPIINGSDAEKSALLISGLDAVTKSTYESIAMASLQMVWIVMAALAGISLILVLLASDKQMNMPEENQDE